MGSLSIIIRVISVGNLKILIIDTLAVLRIRMKLADGTGVRRDFLKLSHGVYPSIYIIPMSV
ncbi:hypothetical protein BDV06DRAFT_200093 [Aspergillus oleicola]